MGDGRDDRNTPTETGALAIALARMLARPVRETEAVGEPDES